jgi:hypothetical protein
MAHSYNPSCRGDRDQEDHSSKPAWASSSRDPILKKIYHKKGLVEWLKIVGPEFKTQYHKQFLQDHT